MTVSVDHHARFSELMLDGGNGGVPRDLAVHALTCRQCTELASSLAVLSTLDLDAAALPAAAPAGVAVNLAAAPRVNAAAAPTAVAEMPVSMAAHDPQLDPALQALAALDLSVAPLVGYEPVAVPAPRVAAPLRAHPEPAPSPALAALAAVDVGNAPRPARAPEPVAVIPPRRRAPAFAMIAAAAAFLFVAGGAAAGAAVLMSQDRGLVGGGTLATETPAQNVLGGVGTPAATPTAEPTDGPRRVGEESATAKPLQTEVPTSTPRATPEPTDTQEAEEPPVAQEPAPPPDGPGPTPTPFVAQPPPPPPDDDPTPAPPPTTEPTPTRTPTPAPTATPTPTPTPSAIFFAGENQGDQRVSEELIGNTTMTFTVALSASSSQTVTVRFATVDGTASGGSDYTAVSGLLEFRPGDTTKTVTVTIHSDLSVENDETFALVLSAPTNATLSDDTAIGTIVDAASDPPT